MKMIFMTSSKIMPIGSGVAAILSHIVFWLEHSFLIKMNAKG